MAKFLANKLCCELNPDWACSYCLWKMCDDCIQTRVDERPQLYEFIDDLHHADAHCSARVQRV